MGRALRVQGKKAGRVAMLQFKRKPVDPIKAKEFNRGCVIAIAILIGLVVVILAFVK